MEVLPISNETYNTEEGTYDFFFKILLFLKFIFVLKKYFFLGFNVIFVIFVDLVKIFHEKFL